MKVVVTGPEGSGTRWLTEVCRTTLGLTDVEHRPMPNHDIWWDWLDDDRETVYVVIQRRPDVTQLSLLAQHARWEGEPVRPLRRSWAQAREWWHRAVQLLAGIPGAYWCTYEALVADPDVQVRALAGWLGVDLVPGAAGLMFPGPMVPTEDGNAKWLTFLERAP